MRTALSDWLLEPTVLAEGVHIDRVLLPVLDYKAVVRVTNRTSRAYLVDTCMEVGQATRAPVLNAAAAG